MTTVSDAAGVPPAGDSGAEEGRDGPDPGVRAEPGVREELDVDAREEPDTREEPDASEEPSLGERALARSRAAARAAPGVAWTLTKGTAVGAFRYRVTGLAAEAAFFALLSLPPLVIGLIGTMGHLRGLFDRETVADIRNWVIEQAQTVLTGPAVDSVVEPLIDDVIKGGSPDIVSVSFLISLWAGSRATNVYVDTITIAYGLSGVRGVIRTRLRAFFLYLVGLLVMLIVIPLLVAGPTLVRQVLPESAAAVQLLYWPVVVSLSIIFLSLLYHVSIPVRTSWWRQVPGGVLALLIWIVGSFSLRLYLAGSLSGVSVYGPLAASIAVLAWLYVAALAVLIGAALNAEIDRLWPSGDTARVRALRDAEDAPEPLTRGPRVRTASIEVLKRANMSYPRVA
ncbi:YihY/virulence factor BrkB family protein [Actinomadura madurae]|uniref:YihY/virulence factor BrkB family protein n=1 Tax=Actinomadura madurae TaxID=1993 RepID=UPI0020D20AC7|nr:YihY/virulence factor BrkB family protein [Actinomadura madurae]MCP9948923.1 YihY/virulence factor BrkB family protein [Actinomadura madurae]MCP9978165.1 YihY/virulence factor BrkB family protein [Actinomadura madurae]MCQ0010315.1 YihY/virulence factor BrkB family protein [Actinomadura madurae]MCQ0014374.1 YihY/virulence factor BrkB family protein [Actinomadura madurae]